MKNMLRAKDKIIIQEVKPLENDSEGFVSTDASKHNTAIVYDIPPSISDLKKGEVVILRERVLPEKLKYQGCDYYFIQPIDILCKVEQ